MEDEVVLPTASMSLATTAARSYLSRRDLARSVSCCSERPDSALNPTTSGHFSRMSGRTLGTGLRSSSNPLSLEILPSAASLGEKSASAAGTRTAS